VALAGGRVTTGSWRFHLFSRWQCLLHRRPPCRLPPPRQLWQDLWRQVDVIRVSQQRLSAGRLVVPRDRVDGKYQSRGVNVCCISFLACGPAKLPLSRIIATTLLTGQVKFWSGQSVTQTRTGVWRIFFGCPSVVVLYIRCYTGRNQTFST
jgi:hypothetical protein